jgi:hypothetical protein
MSVISKVNGCGCPDCDDPVTDNPIQASAGSGGGNRNADGLSSGDIVLSRWLTTFT